MQSEKPLSVDMMDDDHVEQEKEEKKERKMEKEEEADSLDDDDGKVVIVLISKDKKRFPIEKKNAFISKLVKMTLEQDPESKEVMIPGVESCIMEYIVEYMEHHKGTEPPIIPKPLRSKEMKQVCSDPWDATFIDRIGTTNEELYNLILASNYLNIDSLLHLGCAKVASKIKGQPLEKIKQILSKGTKAEQKEEDKKQSKD